MMAIPAMTHAMIAINAEFLYCFGLGMIQTTESSMVIQMPLVVGDSNHLIIKVYFLSDPMSKVLSFFIYLKTNKIVKS